jgi:hypothetical protein
MANEPHPLTSEDIEAMGRDREGRSFLDVLALWEQLVDEIERGPYSGCIDDYTNDAWTRRMIKEWMESLDESVAQRAEKAVAPVDARFVAATRTIGRPLMPGLGPDADHWWFRVPRNMGEELADDLRSIGVIE